MTDHDRINICGHKTRPSAQQHNPLPADFFDTLAARMTETSSPLTRSPDLYICLNIYKRNGIQTGVKRFLYISNGDQNSQSIGFPCGQTFPLSIEGVKYTNVPTCILKISRIYEKIARAIIGEIAITYPISKSLGLVRPGRAFKCQGSDAGQLLHSL